QEIVAGRFREDLYFRLVVITVRLPPLRERVGDALLLARHFLELLADRYNSPAAGFTEQAMRAIAGYPWPGNVRELENEIARAVVLGQGETKIGISALSPHVRVFADRSELSHGGDAPALAQAISMLEAGSSIDEVLSVYETRIIEEALRRAGDN